MATTTRRRWLAFRLRTLLVLMVPLCGALAWVGFSLNWIRQRHDVLAAQIPLMGTGLQLPNDCGAPGGLWLFGETGHKWVDCWVADDLDRLKQLFPEAEVADWSSSLPMQKVTER